MRKILFIISFLVLLNPVKSQTSLLPGDIAFIGINTDGDVDDFDFVLLSPVAGGTTIIFTDCGWNHGTGFNTVDTESHCTWTANTALPAGTIVNVVTNNGNTLPVASTGTFTGDRMLISIAGDQIFAYQGTKESPSFIAAISFNQNSLTQPGSDFDGASISNSTTALPDGLTMGLNAVHVYQSSTFLEQDNIRYKGTGNTGTKLELLRKINTLSNWETDDNNVFILKPFPSGITVNASTLAITPNSLINYAKSGGTTDLTITSNSTWSISSNQTWLTINKTGGTENGQATISAGANPTSSDRSAIVTVATGGLTPIILNVTQSGQATGMDVTNQSNTEIYPNPAKEGFHISSDKVVKDISIIDMRGIKVLSPQVGINGYVSTYGLTQGVYIVKMAIGDTVIEKRLIIGK